MSKQTNLNQSFDDFDDALVTISKKYDRPILNKSLSESQLNTSLTPSEIACCDSLTDYVKHKTGQMSITLNPSHNNNFMIEKELIMINQKN